MLLCVARNRLGFLDGEEPTWARSLGRCSPGSGLGLRLGLGGRGVTGSGSCVKGSEVRKTLACPKS